jgi:hypothetical protein
MCCKTEGGNVELFGRIRIRPNRLDPIILPELRYVIFNEADDILKLNYRAVCIDMEVEARGKTIADATGGLKRSIIHYIDLAISDFGRQKAYDVLMDERRNKLGARKVAHVSYGQAIEHKYKVANENINRRIALMSWPYYNDLLLRLIFMVRFSRLYMSRELAI